ncbi:MAG: CBS domain-containing protein [Deltaproteobacteria bacterium]|nr:CBS domain-containing protein [Deltaproteobacteria bacterium]
MKAPKVSEFMTKQPACVTPRTPVEQVARLMKEYDCGAIPIVGDDTFPIGIVTDRDIVIRAIALGKDPSSLTAGDIMTAPASTIVENASLDDCREALELAQIRRIIVVDRSGRTTGIVSQADLANHLKKKHAGEMLRAISKPEPKLRAATEAAADAVADR